MADTKQTDSKGRFIKGNQVAKAAGVDFGSRPENRHNGAWKKEETPRYKLELIIKMSDVELQELIDNEDTPRFDKNMAKAVQQGQWREIDSMINQIYGKPKESVDISNPDGSLTPVVRIIDERQSSSS